MTDSTQTSGYQVLARKYRPQTFEDMIGQEAMVTTLTNAFKTGRVAHAFMLTGVRGIGKTTTARLLARALNYKSESMDGPSVDFSVMGEHCESIMASSHMDVLEMDAASRTGVENMREMLDSVRYSPVSARYKVYIIDEVHMLSTGAFNALLKTLEEPPDHAKFIFATTEIRKVPITVLSRCQRFDLRRVEGVELAAHLKAICEKEDAKVADDGLTLIARAAEGSVRDALSLLDQAIVQRESDAAEVSFEQVRDMLGLADRGRVLDLFALAASGDAAGALTELRAQYDHGADPVVVMRDMLDICHEVSRAKALGAGAGFDASPDQIVRLTELADSQTMGQITRLWQMLLKAHADVKMAPTPLAAAEMALLRMTVAAELPPPEWAAKLLENPDSLSTPIASHEPKGSSGETLAQAAPTPQMSAPQTAPSSAPTAAPAASVQSAPQARFEPQQTPQNVQEFPDLKSVADYAFETGQKALSSDIGRYVRLVSFAPGHIEFVPTRNAPPMLANNLKSFLTDATGSDWNVIIAPQEKGGETLRETAAREQAEQETRERDHPAVRAALAAFPGATLLEVRPKHNHNIINADFNGGPKDS